MNPRITDSKKKEFFNDRAKVWDEISVHSLEKVEYIIELLEIQGDDRILDVDTGTGILIPFYERYLTLWTEALSRWITRRG